MRRPVAIITGGYRRVGRAIAQALATRGCDLVLTYRSSEAEAQSVADRLQETSDVAVHLERADLDDLADAESFARHLAERLDRADVLVHNASVYGPTSLEETTADTVHKMMRVNAIAPS